MVAKDYRRKAWSTLTGKWSTFALITLVASLIGGACGGITTVARYNVVLTVIASVVGVVVGALVGGPLALGVSACYLKLIRGQKVDIGNMFDGFKNFLNAFLLYLINGILVFLWSLLLIIPGIIKAYAYSMSTYLLADNPTLDANTAREKSVEMMKGHKWRLFCLDLSYIGWYILCILTLGILTFWVAPYHNTARALFYQQLLIAENGGDDSYEYTQNVSQNDGNRQQSDSVFGAEFEPASDTQPATEDKDSTDDEPPVNADDL